MHDDDDDHVDDDEKKKKEQRDRENSIPASSRVVLKRDG